MNKKHILHLAVTTVLLNATLAFGTTLYDSTIIGDNPVSYWPMQETNGPTIYDVVGTNNGTMMVATDAAPSSNNDSHTNFAVNNGSAFIMGSPGIQTNCNPNDTCIYFLYTNADEIVIPYSASLDLLTFTAEAWLQIPDFVSPFVTPEVDMVPLGFEWNTGAQYGWWWDMNDGKSGTRPGQFTFELGKNSATNVSPTGWQADVGPANTNNNGKWVYIVTTYDGNNWIGYYNGVSVSSTAGATHQKVANKSTAIAMVMGSYDANGLTTRQRFYGGGMSHVAVYNYALTPGQVLTHYQIGTLCQSPPTYGSGPVGFTNYVGYSNALTVIAGGTALQYQWYKGASMVPGATSSTLAFNSLQLTNAGSYFVTVSNNASFFNSPVAAVGVLALPANPYQAAVISNFPVAFYPLNETAGTVANDIIQEGLADQNQAIYVNTPTLGSPGASSYLGTSAALDGETMGIDVTNANAMNISGNTTMEAWVQLNYDIVDQWIIGHGPNPNDTNPSQVSDVLGIALDYNTNSNPNSNAYYFIQRFVETSTPTNVGAYFPVPAGDLNAGQWVYLVGTADGVAWNLYRNGVLVATTPDTVGAGLANGGWAFGARNDNLFVETPFFWGSIQDVAIYGYALTPQEIQQHYQIGLTGSYTALPAPTVAILQSGGNVIVSWTGGSLESAPSVSGPWTYLTNADSSVVSSPYTIAATNSAQYFQASLQAP